METYDFDLEGIHDLKGVVEIRFPTNKRCYATIDAFENRTLSLDAEGNFSMNHKGLEMTGNVNTRTGMGTGKFKLKATSSGDDFVTEAEAFDGWYAYNLWVYAGKPLGQIPQVAWTDLKHFDADFTVEGTLSIQYSELMQRYAIHLDGIGGFNFNGVVYASGNDTYWAPNEDGILVLKYHSKSMELSNIFVKDGSFVFSPTLIYQ